ncbi:MAG: hypothetical protein ABS75_26730 [Pelagibacterium sp. SCN 63-23]|nr:MAG: hypothetical protein ABS75_26730 [Pelagibacterium sp. SCN 63-23]
MNFLTLNKTAALTVLALLLVGADLIGNLSAYGYAIILLAMLPVLLSDPAARRSMWNGGSLAYLVAFLLLFFAFVFSAQHWSDVQYAGNFTFFLLFAPAIALFSFGAGPRATEVFASLALAGAAISLLSALYEVYGLGYGRAVGFVNLTNPFAMASVMLGYLSLTGFWARKDRWRYLFLLGPIFAAGTSVLAGTRAAIVMLACLFVLFVLFWSFTLDRKKRLWAWAGGAALAIAGIALAIIFSSELRALSAFQTLAVFFGQGQAIDFSTEIRLNLYYGGIQAFLESPLFGHGWWRHFEAARPYMSEVVQQKTVRWSHLHNDYVNFAALAGIMGVGAYLIYMVTPLIGAIRSSKDSQYLPRLFGASTILVCYAVFGLFDTSFSMEVLLGFGPVCAAALLGFCVDRPSSAEA